MQCVSRGCEEEGKGGEEGEGCEEGKDGVRRV